MKKLLLFILSIGICFSFVACKDDKDIIYQSSTSDSTIIEKEIIDDISDLSNDKTLELAKLLKKSSVYPTNYGDNNIIAERLRVYQANSQYDADCQALEEARNSRTVRVYNAQTGQFEMRPDEKAIKSAAQQVVISYDLLGSSILNANTTIEGATYGKIINELESYTATNSKIKSILENSLQYYEKLPLGCTAYSNFPEYTKDIPDWINSIKKVIKEFCGISL